MRCEVICQNCNTSVKSMDMDSHVCEMKLTKEVKESRHDHTLLASEQGFARISQIKENQKAIKENLQNSHAACVQTYEINRQLQHDIQKATELSSKIKKIDKKLSDLDLRMRQFETSNFDGTLVWKIRDYRNRVQNGVIPLYSQPFYTSRHGYKLCGQVYLNGDGTHPNMFLSFFFILMKGDFDALLPWPFKQQVTFMLMDQETRSQNLSKVLNSNRDAVSFKRPDSKMNVTSGFPHFVERSKLETRTYLQEDTIFLMIKVDTTNLPERF
ncbi:TNF receptor-associated factor 3-like [Pecten maximus]|uniref:TNF receptor-associated factor 3-like n=1 Tax=Pecten maximus TaxID=6579 RepID=UPI0014584566|nr:TNF receptor-associated factor 3-like [Pecten maximus]